MSYGDYLRLDTLLSAQSPLTAEHDELLFITIHQVMELWLKLLNRELDTALAHIRADELQPAFKCTARINRIQEQLIQAWTVLSTMTPPEVSEAVARGDVIKLASVPGLGKKTAERLVLELRGKDLVAFGPEPAVASNGGGGGPFMEARDALAALGYRIEEAEKALNDVPPQDSVEKYIKEALRRIGSRR